MHIHIHTCIHTYIYKYMHTHTHTHEIFDSVAMCVFRRWLGGNGLIFGWQRWRRADYEDVDKFQRR